MKKRLISLSLLATAMVSLTAFVKIYSGGIVGVTGSPGEGLCSGCHAGGSGVTSVNISATPAFVGNQYQPGQTYTIELTVSNNAFGLFAFDCEILTTTNTNAGTMATPFAGVQFANSGVRKNATHTGPKSGTGSATFEFTWVAPTSGSARIYVAGNAINGTGSTGGDTPGNANLLLTPNLVGVSEQVASSANFNLYPNPVINDFKMQYTLVGQGNVKATLYNLRGQEVKILFDEDQSVGIHSVSANLPQDLQAGIYMVKLSVNDAPYAQRMLVKQ